MTKKVLLSVKGKLCTIVVRPSTIYESEYWTSNKKEETQINVTEMSMLIGGHVV